VTITPGAANELRAVIRDGAGNSTEVVRVVDNDGIQSLVPPTVLAPAALDRGRTAGDDQSGVYSNEFNNGITTGTIARNGWTTTLSATAAPPRPLIGLGLSFWPSTGWVQFALTGPAAPAQAIVSACVPSPTGFAGVKQVRLDAVGERAAFACDPVTGTIAVKALSASPTIEVWKQISPTMWLGIPLVTGTGVSTGSPTTAFADNPEPVDVKVVRYDDTGVAHVIGTFRLDPGSTADVQINPDASGRDDEVVFRALRGAVPVSMGGLVRRLDEGAEASVPIDRTPPRIDVQRPKADAIYLLKQPVKASFSCVDDRSGVATCDGAVPNDSAFATSSVGVSSFTVAAADEAGNTGSASVPYKVTYRIAARNDEVTRADRKTRVAFRLEDADGVNLSAPGIVATALELASANGTIHLENAGFRFDPGARAYELDLDTGDLAGAFTLSFTVSGDPVTHAIEFRVR